MIAGFRLVLKAVTKNVMEEFRSLKEDIYLNSTATTKNVMEEFRSLKEEFRSLKDTVTRSKYI